MKITTHGHRRSILYLGNGEVEEDVVAGDAVGGVGGPGVRDQQAGDPALRAPHAAALAQVKHLQGGDLDMHSTRSWSSTLNISYTVVQAQIISHYGW